jgi:ribonuclease HIII
MRSPPHKQRSSALAGGSRLFEFQTKPYCLYAGRKAKVNVLVYEKGPKVVVQGKETEDFVSHLLEPEDAGRGQARL